jgi:hypothetical protein
MVFSSAWCGTSAYAAPKGQGSAARAEERRIAPPHAQLSDADWMPAIRSASVSAPSHASEGRARLPGQSSALEDVEILGQGEIDVSIICRSTDPAFLKIRDDKGVVKAAVHLVSGKPSQVKLDGGAYQMYLRANLNGRVVNLKAPPFDLPRGARGSVDLMLEVRTAGGMGSSMQEITPEEFDR